MSENKEIQRTAQTLADQIISRIDFLQDNAESSLEEDCQLNPDTLDGLEINMDTENEEYSMDENMDMITCNIQTPNLQTSTSRVTDTDTNTSSKFYGNDDFNKVVTMKGETFPLVSTQYKVESSLSLSNKVGQELSTSQILLPFSPRFYYTQFGLPKEIPVCPNQSYLNDAENNPGIYKQKMMIFQHSMESELATPNSPVNMAIKISEREVELHLLRNQMVDFVGKFKKNTEVVEMLGSFILKIDGLINQNLADPNFEVTDMSVDKK